jgi:hypothetical protein
MLVPAGKRINPIVIILAVIAIVVALIYLGSQPAHVKRPAVPPVQQ